MTPSVAQISPRAAVRLNRVRAGTRGLLALGSIWIAIGAGCGSDAVGVDACRKIESARCRLAEACGDLASAAACERFYRDDCLHGFGIEQPSDRDVDECVQRLDAATECVRSDSEDASCTDVCGFVSYPERAAECAFLSKDPPQNGGQAGAAQGGSSAQAGAAAGGAQAGASEGGEPAEAAGGSE